jgi:hypothetical protein
MGIMSGGVVRAGRSDGLAGLLAVGAAVAFGTFHADGHGTRGGQVEGLEVDLGEAADSFLWSRRVWLTGPTS